MALAAQPQHRLSALFEDTSLVELRCATSGPWHSPTRLPGQLCDRRVFDPATAVSRHQSRPNQAHSSRYAAKHLRNGGTPEKILVTDLVTAHTSPRHENGPQAELAGR
jgi:hypothetical protein